LASLVLDAGVLIDLERRDQRARAWLEEAVARGDVLLVAGATYAEVWRGYRNGKGHNMSKVLKAVAPVPTSEAVGRRAGELMHKAGAAHELGLDAIVVATAEKEKADVVTKDPKDIALLAGQALRVGVRST
jgi:predicted nucleic acid-binding protein